MPHVCMRVGLCLAVYLTICYCSHNPPLPLLARAHVTSVITGVGERQEEPAPRKPVVDASKPYLIIDARDTDAYDACQIVGGEWALCVVRNRR